MSEARYNREAATFNLQAEGALDALQVIQVPSGEAAFVDSLAAVTSGAYTDKPRTSGKVDVAKASGVYMLPGQGIWWDHSANEATYRKVNDRDFYLGTVVTEATSAARSVTVELNRQPRYDIDLARDAFLTSITGTQGHNTMGLFRRGGAHKLILSSTSEVQKVDALSVDGFSKDANWIVEGQFRVVAGGAGSAPDLSLGIANATHATDADAIAESVFIHLNGNDVNIYAESDDGTTEVAATDTTIDYTAGSAVANRVHFLMDGRNPADVQIYINGALVLGATVFNVNVAAGPLFLLAHLEKTSAADVFEVDVDFLRVWYSEQ